jgi:endonuclease/exonuclease/phosphatase family metal-dependent hydrolase
MTSRTVGAGRWRVAWWVVGCVVLVLFGGSNAATYVSPDTLWVLQLLGVVGPGLGILLVVIGVAAALVRFWWLAGLLFSAVVLAVGGDEINSRSVLPSPSGSIPLETEPLRVMTFNANPAQLDTSREGVQALLKHEPPHVVALQEFTAHLDRSTGNQSGPWLLLPFLKDDRFTISWPASNGNVLLERPILSRIESSGPVEVLSESLEGEARRGLWRSGGVTRGTYRWQGQVIAIYNVHLHSFGRERPWQEPGRRMLSLEAWAKALRTYRNDFVTRAKQARVLRQIMDEEERPFIVCGDLNSTSHSWVYAYLARGLTDSFRKAGAGWGGTFPARAPLLRIDFVLASKEWEVREAQVGSALSSDHVPVIADLVLRSGEATDQQGAKP